MTGRLKLPNFQSPTNKLESFLPPPFHTHSVSSPVRFIVENPKDAVFWRLRHKSITTSTNCIREQCTHDLCL
ncbi:hypothetical protein OIU78_026635 [Salix suchowensis]|nr:hypothetical protein OIU78_026635 [Salix suchowensis]